MNDEQNVGELMPMVEELAFHYRKYFRWAWRLISSETPVFNWHIDYIADRLQNLGSFIIAREPSPGDMVINIPPGMTKSSLVSQIFISWLWLHDPSICVIVSSYSGLLSIDHSLKAKKIIESDEWGLFRHYIHQRHGHELTFTRNTEKHWENNFGGFFYATSTGGSVTGKHAHLIIRDDPLNPEQSVSDTGIKKTNRFNDETLSDRKKDKQSTPTITVMQRLNENDPTGHDVKRGLVNEHICLPGKIENAETTTVKPRKLIDNYMSAGGLLDPIRLPETVLADKKIRLGSYAYAGQYDQTPSPIGGGIIKTKWFDIVDALPNGMGFKDVVWNFILDTAFSAKTESNDTALIAYTYIQNDWFVRECFALKLDFPDMLDLVKGFTSRNGYSSQSRIYIEPKATGVPLIQTIKRETGLNVIPTESPIDDKVTRVNNHVPEMESGRVHLLRGQWNESYLHELGTFPRSAQDGRVDVTAYMLGIKGGTGFRMSSIKQSHRTF